MSIRAAQSAAFSALQASQSGVAVSSNNIANASVEGYTAKSQALTTSVTSGTTTGVTVSSTGSTVDTYLLKSINTAASASGYASVFTTPLETVSSAFGTVGDSTELSAQIADLETSLATLAASPESQAQASLVLTEASEIADSLNALSATVQNQRSEADQKIEDTVGQINTLLYEIQSYNDQLGGSQSGTLSQSELVDARNSAIQKLSELVDVTYFNNSNNQTQIYIGGTLVVGSKVQELEYDATGSVTQDTVFGDITVNGKSVTSSINGGTLGGLIDLRDETLPAIQAELDMLATTLMDSINAITNTGSSYPGAESLTSSVAVDAADAFSGTGTVRLVATDDDGVAREILDIDLSAVATVQDLVDAINSATNLSAAVNADGTLTISGENNYNVVLVNMDAVAGAENQGFSDYFGLNDMFVGTSAADISVNAAWLANPGLFPTGSGSDDAGLAVGDTAVFSGSSDVASALANLFDDNIRFDSAGGLGSTKTTLSGYAAEVLSNVAQTASAAQSKASVAEAAHTSLVQSFSNQYGVNVDEESLAISNLENAYEAAAAVMSITQSMMDTLLEMVR